MCLVQSAKKESWVGGVVNPRGRLPAKLVVAFRVKNPSPWLCTKYISAGVGSRPIAALNRSALNLKRLAAAKALSLGL